MLSAEYLSNQNIIHRDFKPENILIEYNRKDQSADAYVADFGFAEIYKHSSQKIEILYGTPGFLAPE